MTENWASVPISELYEGLFDGPHATPKSSDKGPVFLGIKNVTDDGCLDLSDIRHIAENDFQRWTKRVEPRLGDLVFTYEATLNRYALIPEGFRGCLGRRMALIRPNPRKVDGRFLLYYFFSDAWRAVIKNNMLTGATVDRIPLTTFPNFPVSAPPLHIQRRIANILSAYDELLENNQRRIRILEDMARSLYREWFVHFRYPGHESIPLIDSPLGRIPQGWEVRKVSELLAKIGRREKIKTQDYLPSGVLPVIDQGRELIGGYTDNTDAEYSGDLPVIVFGDHTRTLKFIDFPFACGADGTQLLRSNDERMPASLFFYMLSAVKLSNFAYARHFKFLKDELVVVPDIGMSITFEERVGPIKKQIRTLRQQSDNLRRTRDLLLSRLLSGQIDLAVVEETI